MRKVVLGILLLSLAGAARATQQPSQATPALLHALKKAVESSTSFPDRYTATVWLLDMSTRLKPLVPNPTARLHILEAVHREALRAELSPELVLAVIQVESDFNRFAISSAGAEGLMQVMPFWLDKIGHAHANLFHVDTNLRIGCTILKYYLGRSKGDIFEALARYNGSYGRLTYPNRVLKALRTRWYRR
jgi:soluble lytic murein transglycosylase-like protein